MLADAKLVARAPPSIGDMMDNRDTDSILEYHEATKHSDERRGYVSSIDEALEKNGRILKLKRKLLLIYTRDLHFLL